MLTALELPGYQVGKCQVMVFVLGLGPCYVHLCLQGSYVCPCCCKGLLRWSDLQLTQYIFILNLKQQQKLSSLSLLLWVGVLSTGWPPTHHPLLSASSGEIGSQACATTAQPCFFCVSTLCGCTCLRVYVCMCVHVYMCPWCPDLGALICI